MTGYLTFTDGRWHGGSAPMVFGETGFIIPDAAAARVAIVIHDAPLPPRGHGFTATPVRQLRPLPMTAPTDTKASCLYPNVARAVAEARAQGFDNAILCDPLGNVVEFANSNLFLSRGRCVMTPAINGTFRNGITRPRVIALLRGAGHAVDEAQVTLADLESADEVFSTGNWAKVQPVTRIGTRELPAGPVFHTASALYWAFAHAASVWQDEP